MTTPLSFHHSRNTVVFIFSILACIVTTQSAYAAPKITGYRAELSGRSAGTVTMTTGKAVPLWVEFTNTGTKPWTRNGKHIVALNVTDPIGRTSVFQYKTWKRYFRPTVLKQPSVAPGAKGKFPFVVQAPTTPGTYEEHFQLLAENTTWIDGGTLKMTIVVTPPPPPYQAQIVGQSANALTLKTGQRGDVWVDVKNTGTATWKNDGNNFIALNVTDPAGRTSVFRAATWTSVAYRPATLAQKTVKPGQVTRLPFSLQAPNTQGTFSESFQLVAENLAWIPGSHITLPITVESPVAEAAQGEPILDVGITAMAEPVVVASTSPMTITANGTVVGHAPAAAQITLSYANGTYSATGADAPLSGTDWYVVSADGGGIMEAVNFENRPAWNTSLNDNTFRDGLSLRASSEGTTWLVNSLPMEQYLRGLGEASNNALPEYQKALIIAARSYAQYHVDHGTKHAAEHFTVNATNDQVYRGYNLELRTPNITKAVDDTYGLEVTYQGGRVITPYFAHTDGRTRAWEEVWSGGPFAWLVSVPVPEDAGYSSLYGHGVGMSGNGGLVMANNGKTYDQILKYFYTGIEITPQYTKPASTLP